MGLIIDINKAKVIAHDIRRAKRAEEFAPHDEVISKQIPGASTEEAEVARTAIRAKYETIQTSINEAASTDDLKTALGLT